jgi:predicted ATPase/DNA-binding XRE family transcriptional regulator
VQSDASPAFGELLRRFRARAGLSQDALAERSGLSRRAIADLERGARRFPYSDTAARLAGALGLEPTERAMLLASGLRPDHSISARRRALPVERTELIGREEVLGELAALLRDTRLLTLTGPGGIGKTRLAEALGRRIEADYPGGAVFVDLTPVTDPMLVPQAAALALGVQEQRDKSVSESIEEHTRAASLLMVLDNCEHVLSGSARLADTLARTSPGIRIVATSREPLRIHGETVWMVPPLKPSDACRLFVERANAAQASHPVANGQAAIIEEICRRLDGIPLAIELAAVRVPALGVVQIATILADRMRALSGGMRLDALRHQTLTASIDWSYALLTDRERRLFERLSVFSGGWNLGGATAVCGWGVIEPDDVVELLTGLVDKSLVVAEIQGDQMRYRLLETIRNYAGDRLETSGQAAETRRRHARHILKLAEADGLTRLGIRYPADMDQVSREYDNVRAALGALLALGDLEDGLALCEALGGFWFQGHLTEGEEWIARFLDDAVDAKWESLANGFHVAGRLAEYHGAFDRAQRLHERGLAISSAHDDATLSARALCGLGDVALHRGQYNQAQETLRKALAQARVSGSLPEIAQALLSLGRASEMAGDVEASRQYLEEGLHIDRQLGDRWGVAYVLNELGQQARRDGRLEHAQALHEESHVLWRQSGTRVGERAALMNLAIISLERAAMGRATALARDSLELCRELADWSATTVRCIEIASEVLSASGSTEVALTLVSAATAEREVLGAPIPPLEQGERNQTLNEAYSKLTAEASERAVIRGSNLTIQEAVELAADALTALEATRSW